MQKADGNRSRDDRPASWGAVRNTHYGANNNNTRTLYPEVNRNILCFCCGGGSGDGVDVDSVFWAVESKEKLKLAHNGLLVTYSLVIGIFEETTGMLATSKPEQMTNR